MGIFIHSFNYYYSPSDHQIFGYSLHTNKIHFPLIEIIQSTINPGIRLQVQNVWVVYIFLYFTSIYGHFQCNKFELKEQIMYFPSQNSLVEDQNLSNTLTLSHLFRCHTTVIVHGNCGILLGIFYVFCKELRSILWLYSFFPLNGDFQVILLFVLGSALPSNLYSHYFLSPEKLNSVLLRTIRQITQ